MGAVLFVQGACHGGWRWFDLEHRRRDLGHRTHAPTRTGLGGRSHLAAPDFYADLHVKDIVNAIRWRELPEVIPVGHSYGGLIISGVASERPDAIKGLIYFDAAVPSDSGISPFESTPERMRRFELEAGQTCWCRPSSFRHGQMNRKKSLAAAHARANADRLFSQMGRTERPGANHSAQTPHHDPEVTETTRMVDPANRLAAAGCPFVLKSLSDNPLRTTPPDQMLELARSLQGRMIPED